MIQIIKGNQNTYYICVCDCVCACILRFSLGLDLLIYLYPIILGLWCIKTRGHEKNDYFFSIMRNTLKNKKKNVTIDFLVNIVCSCLIRKLMQLFHRWITPSFFDLKEKRNLPKAETNFLINVELYRFNGIHQLGGIC